MSGWHPSIAIGGSREHAAGIEQGERLWVGTEAQLSASVAGRSKFSYYRCSIAAVRPEHRLRGIQVRRPPSKPRIYLTML